MRPAARQRLRPDAKIACAEVSSCSLRRGADPPHRCGYDERTSRSQRGYHLGFAVGTNVAVEIGSTAPPASSSIVRVHRLRFHVEGGAMTAIGPSLSQTGHSPDVSYLL